MVVDSSGDIFLGYTGVSVGANSGILKIAANGTLSTFYSSSTTLPAALAIDPTSAISL